MAPEVIAVNQDSLGVQGKKLFSEDNLEVWGGPLSNGRTVGLLLNRGEKLAEITATWETLGLEPTDSYQVRNIWARANLGTFTKELTAEVESHGVFMFVLSPIADVQ